MDGGEEHDTSHLANTGGARISEFSLYEGQSLLVRLALAMLSHLWSGLNLVVQFTLGRGANLAILVAAIISGIIFLILMYVFTSKALEN